MFGSFAHISELPTSIPFLPLLLFPLPSPPPLPGQPLCKTWTCQILYQALLFVASCSPCSGVLGPEPSWAGIRSECYAMRGLGWIPLFPVPSFCVIGCTSLVRSRPVVSAMTAFSLFILIESDSCHLIARSV